jgi:hypothetical protein
MIPCLAPVEIFPMEEMLESVVVLNWNELLQGPHKGMVHVEVGTAPEPSLQYLKIWLSKNHKGWDLICEYWASSGSAGSPARGLTFSNGYLCASLAEMLEKSLRRHDGFPAALSGETKLNLILVASPTDEDRRKAAVCMSATYQRLGLTFAGPTRYQA